MADLRRLAQQAVAKLYHDSFIHGRLGRLNSDGSYTVRVPDRPTHAYVQMASEGGQTIATARNPGNVRLAANLPVRMRSESGDLIIDGLDYAKLAMVESADPDGPPAHGIPTHHHRIGSGLEYEYDPRLFEAGRVYHAGSMSVHINPFRYQKADGTFEYWPGGALNISSQQPATSGEHAWVLVGIDPSDNTATAAAGTAKADTSELTIAELDDISFAGKIPCGAVRVREDDTDLSDLTKYVDAHGWFNQTLNQLRSLTGNLGVYVADDGDVAVGHESPSSPLDVSGEMRTDTRLLSPVVRALNANGLRLEDKDGNLGLFVEDGGKVVVNGTTADVSGLLKLQVDADAASKGIVKIGVDSGEAGTYLVRDRAGGTNYRDLELAGNDLVFFTADSDEDTSITERVRIKHTTGRVGIKQSDPLADLQVDGTVRLNVMAGFDTEGNVFIGRADDVTSRYNLIKSNVHSSGAGSYLTLAVHTGTVNTTIDALVLTGDGYAQPNALGEAWNAPSFNTGWGNSGSGYNVGYRKFGDMVMLRGVAERTSGSATTIFTLPAGYRPSSPVQGLAEFGGGIGVRLTIQTSGNVIIPSGYTNGDDVWLDGIMFSI